ncbi:cilia- and flagella-associated protein 276 [Brachyistius frenatus]|uniref:cilia- and flagella-associated protein 276 n=1 Tax=Brachyistius frenatus TaxID=100188 RepID=UPI0037E7830E
MSSRDPFPSQKVENDITLSGIRPRQRKTFKPTHIAQTEEPWCHLHHTATFSSTQQSVMRHEYQAPKDSLDRHLKSVYNHHDDIFWGKNQVLYQQDTITQAHRKLMSSTCRKRNKTKTSQCGSTHRGAPFRASNDAQAFSNSSGSRKAQ